MSREAKALAKIISNIDNKLKVIILDSLANVDLILKKDFRLLLVSSEFVDIEKWPLSLTETKDIFVIDKSRTMDKKGRNYIQLCTIGEIHGLLKMLLLQNPTYSNHFSIEESKEMRKKSSVSNETLTVNVKKHQRDSNNPGSKSSPLTNKHVDFINSIEIPREIELLKSGVYSLGARNEDKIIGIWSPNSAGTTTLVISLALYLRKIIDRIGVIELPSPRATHEKILSKYGSKPENWASFYETYKLLSEKKHQFKWEYGGVLWYPCGSKDDVWGMDEDEEGNEDLYRPEYIGGCYETLLYNARKHNNLVFVDIPSILNRYNRGIIYCELDELWVVSDEKNIKEKDYREFLTSLKEEGVNSKLIFVGDSPVARRKGRAEKAAHDFGIPLLASLPYLEREIRNNISYERVPPIENPKIRKALNPVFFDLAVSLTGDKERVLSRVSRSNIDFLLKRLVQAFKE